MTTVNAVNTYIVPTTNREVTVPSQPAFLAYQGTQDNNVTGDGTNYVLGDTNIGTTLTEIFDQNADFVAGALGGAVFTAPVTGKYVLSCGIHSGGYDGTQSSRDNRVITSNGEYRGLKTNSTNTRNAANEISSAAGIMADMDAADTCNITFRVEHGNKTVDVLNTNRNTFFSGYLAV